MAQHYREIKRTALKQNTEVKGVPDSVPGDLENDKETDCIGSCHHDDLLL